ncbi:MAG: hypothetical protein JST75_03980 [Bacteroidetes bacterium]|nr:hypothetical protein [Bacteroidota bacterium]
MEKRSFAIRFEIWLVKSNKLFAMQAIAQPAKADHSYLIHSFSSSQKFNQDKIVSEKLALPYLSIQRVERNGKKIWVHNDSGKETMISVAIGKAIDSHDHVLYSSQQHPFWHKQRTGS